MDRGRIGGLGLSTGADVLIDVAANDRRLKAVVADGATGRSAGDKPEGGLDPVSTAWFWTMYAAMRVFSGERAGPPLKQLAAEVSPTPLLLIAAGRGPMEIEFNRVYAKAAREPVELWALPEVGHTAAIRERAAQYERRVTSFLAAALDSAG